MAMWAFRTRNAAPSAENVSTTAANLVRAFDLLTAEEARRTGDRLFVLYKWFVEEFGDLHQFLQQREAEQVAYLAQLNSAKARASALSGRAATEADQAISLLHCYIECHRQTEASPAIRALCDRVVGLIDERVSFNVEG
jgi:hypothetical protein